MPTAAADHRHFLATRDRFLTLFRAEAEHRRERDSFVDTAMGREPAWVVAEREAMWTLVDHLRRQYGHEPVHIAAVERVESSACGHVDYAEKFALYCAELAHGYRDTSGRHLVAHLNA